MDRSMKLPAGIVTDPVAGQLPFVLGEQDSVVLLRLDAEAPERNVTVILPDWRELT